MHWQSLRIHSQQWEPKGDSQTARQPGQHRPLQSSFPGTQNFQDPAGHILCSLQDNTQDGEEQSPVGMSQVPISQLFHVW